MRIPRYSEKLYNEMVKRAIKMRSHTPETIYHNSYMVNKISSLNSRTFEGYSSCGHMTHCLAPILKEDGYKNIKLMFSKINSGRHMEDHVYLLINDEYIFDPTWRQFFGSYIYKNEKLSKFLYIDNPPIFVGNYIDLHNTISEAILLSGIKCKTSQQSIKKMWINSKDITDKMTM